MQATTFRNLEGIYQKSKLMLIGGRHCAGARGLLGLSRREVAEAIGVSIMMHGGPATIYGARAYTAFCEFVDANSNPPA